MKDKLIWPLLAALLITAAIVGRDMFKPPRDLYAQGMGPGPNVSRAVGALTGATTSYDFGTVTSTATASYSMVMTALTVTIYPSAPNVSGTNYTDFSATDNCGTVRPASSTCIMTYTFTPPTLTGAKNATITVPYTW
jgi:hypothetical protein